jgi:hypothetical protein
MAGGPSQPGRDNDPGFPPATAHTTLGQRIIPKWPADRPRDRRPLRQLRTEKSR